MQEMGDNQKPGETRIIQWDGREIQIQEVVHRGWEGILYRIQNEDRYLLAFLEWQNGGYLERFRPLHGTELDQWLNEPDAGRNN